jgi:thiosulfate/3-mercaptopyruvate sulfurtransferase
MNSILVETDWLEAHLTDPDLRIFDCTGALVDDPQTMFRSISGRSQYEAGHIPGADYLDLHEELSDRTSPFLFTLPSIKQFATVMSRHGVESGVRVVLYSAGRISWATRVWWMLRVFGFNEVAVLNGGWEKWNREGRPLSRCSSTYQLARFNAQPQFALLAMTSDILSNLGSNQMCLINALLPDQYTGASNIHYGRRGHIPGSVNLPYLNLLNLENGTFLPLSELQTQLNVIGALNAKSIVSYCGGGIGATAIAFALALLGRHDVAVYDGSMLEWSHNVSLPIERG